MRAATNAEHHNHNDAGSFVVALERGMPLVDLGAEVYTARTFSGRRYEGNLLNSLGHPVPRIAGQLQRTFRFSRQGRGSLEVLDEVQLAQPETFETALITFGKWKQATPNKLTVGDREGTVEVEIDTGGAAFTIRAEEIQEDRGGPPPTRLGIALDQPAKTATVRLTIRPAP